MSRPDRTLALVAAAAALAVAASGAVALAAPSPGPGAPSATATPEPATAGPETTAPPAPATTSPPSDTIRDPEPLAWRFPVGEEAVYDVTFGRVRVGESTLSVAALDTIRSEPVYRIRFTVQGGPFFYKVDDRQHTWVAPDPVRSLRFEQRLRQGDYERDHRYELDQAAGTYSLLTWDEEAGEWTPAEERTDVPMPPAALDEISFLYLVRLLPLEVGRTYRFERYFEEEGNPVILQVLRKQEVRVPAGTFRTVVVRPIIQTDGLFAEGGEAEVYISDDAERRIVQLRSSMKVGSLNMYLKDYEPGPSDGLLSARDSSGR